MKRTEENNTPVLSGTAQEMRSQDTRDTNTTAKEPNAPSASESATPPASIDGTPRRRSRRSSAAARSEAAESAAPTSETSGGTDTETADAPKRAASARSRAGTVPDAPPAQRQETATVPSAPGERPETAEASESVPSVEGPPRRKRSRNRRRKSATEETPADGGATARSDPQNDSAATDADGPQPADTAKGERTQASARRGGTRRRSGAPNADTAEPDGTSAPRKGADAAAGSSEKTADRKESASNRRQRSAASSDERKNDRQDTGRNRDRNNARSDRPKQRQEPSRRNAADDRSTVRSARTDDREPQQKKRRARTAAAKDIPGRQAPPRPVKIEPGKRLRPGTVAAERVWALVTGAGTGIGRSYALRLAASGYRLVLAGDRRAPLESVRREIVDAAAAGGRRESCEVRICQLDLARTDAAEKLVAWTRAQKISVDLLINNAGIFSFRDILRTPIERIERIILLHDLTLTKLCRLYASDMVYREVQGHILNMSSFSLWMPFPGLSLYSASKAYIRSFSVSFAREVRESGIRVTAVCPAGVATGLYGLSPRWQRIGLRCGALISADACARRGLRALRRGRRCIVPDWWNRIWIPLCKSLPMTLLRPLRKLTMKFQK